MSSFWSRYQTLKYWINGWSENIHQHIALSAGSNETIIEGSIKGKWLRIWIIMASQIGVFGSNSVSNCDTSQVWVDDTSWAKLSSAADNVCFETMFYIKLTADY